MKNEWKSNRKDGLTRIGGTVSELRLPDDVFKRLGGVPTKSDAEWYCNTCGMAPQCREYANGYIPGRCSCQLAQLQRDREERDRLEQWRWQEEQRRKSCAKCYTWLGPEWTSIGLATMTLGNFDMNLQPDAYVQVCDYAQVPSGNLVLWSPDFGTGKTHLAAAIANFRLAQNNSCRFTEAQNLFNAIGARLDAKQGYTDIIASASATPLLVIDDLEKVHISANGSKFVHSTFFEIINRRYQSALPTVITTNSRIDVSERDVDGLSQYLGGAAVSRLCDRARGGLISVEMSGQDYRRL